MDKLAEALRDEITEAVKAGVEEYVGNNTLEVDAENVSGLSAAVEEILGDYDFSDNRDFEKAVDHSVEEYLDNNKVEVKADAVEGLDDEIDERIERYLEREEIKVHADNVEDLGGAIEKEFGAALDQRIDDHVSRSVTAFAGGERLRDVIEETARRYLTETSRGQSLLAAAVRAEVRRMAHQALLYPWQGLTRAWQRMRGWGASIIRR